MAHLAVDDRSKAIRLSSEMSNIELQVSQSSLKGPANHLALQVDSPMATCGSAMRRTYTSKSE